MRGFLLLLVAACGGDSGDETLFSPDYASTYTLVRSCRTSVDHDSRGIRIFAAPDAVTPYNDRVTPFATGAVLVKEEYSRLDTSCSGAIVEVTAMRRGATDWEWQRTNGELEPIAVEVSNCAGCHAQCPGGYAGTCAPP